MKTLTFRSTKIEFRNPGLVTFESAFDKKMYEHCYTQLTTGSNYQPNFDTDAFCSPSAPFDLKAEYYAAGYALPTASKKSSDKGLEICKNHPRFLFQISRVCRIICKQHFIGRT